MPNSKKRDHEKSLCVLTLRHANVGRFFNSIIPAAKTELMPSQNVKAVRGIINGEATVFFKTIRGVKKGETLLINYN